MISYMISLPRFALTIQISISIIKLMSFSLRIRPSHLLETAADFSTNIAAGFFFTAFIAREPWVLTGNVIGATLLFGIAIALKSQAGTLS